MLTDAYVIDVLLEAVQWLLGLFTIALYLDYRRLRARIAALEAEAATDGLREPVRGAGEPVR